MTRKTARALELRVWANDKDEARAAIVRRRTGHASEKAEQWVSRQAEATA